MWLFSHTGNLTSSNSASVLLMSYRRYSFLTICNTGQMGVSQLKMCTYSNVKIWGEWGRRCIKLGGLQECDCSVQQEREASFSEQRRRAGLQPTWWHWLTVVTKAMAEEGQPTCFLLYFFKREWGKKPLVVIAHVTYWIKKGSDTGTLKRDVQCDLPQGDKT